MTRRLFTRAIPILLLCLLSATAFAEDNMHWYITETECSNAKITIRSHCENNENAPANTFCPEQSLIIENPNGTKMVKKNLLEKQTIKDEFLTVYAVSCVPVNSTTNYLYFKLANGGNCPECEGTAVMDLRGYWKYFGKHWFVSKEEKRQIIKRDDEWYHLQGMLLRNKTEEAIKK